MESKIQLLLELALKELQYKINMLRIIYYFNEKRYNREKLNIKQPQFDDISNIPYHINRCISHHKVAVSNVRTGGRVDEELRDNRDRQGR